MTEPSAAVPTPAASGPPAPLRSIFLCYRREDTEDMAGRVRASLETLLSRPGRKVTVFMDQMSIPAGARWQEMIGEEIGRSDVVLVLIGRKWLEPGADGPRLFEESDQVRFEIAKAIALEKPIVPVLVNQAPAPKHDALPLDLAELADIHCATVTTRNYDTEIGRLRQEIREAAAKPVSAAPRRHRTAAVPVSRVVSSIVALAAVVAAVLFLLPRVVGSPQTVDPTTPVAPVPPAQRTTTPPTTPSLPVFAPEPNVVLVDSPRFAAMTTAHQIRIGTNADQPGLSSRDPTTRAWVGFDVGIENLVAAKLGFPESEIDRVSVDTGELADLVKAGDVDMAISGYTITSFRRQTLSFAGPYLQAGQSILVRRDEQQIVDENTLRGKKVCAVVGSTGAYKITHPALGQAQTVQLSSTAECVDALREHGVDAVTTDDAILAGYQQQYPEELKLTGGEFSVEPWGIALGKTEKALCEKINGILTDALADGDWNKVFDATLGRSGIQVTRPTPSDTNCG